MIFYSRNSRKRKKERFPSFGIYSKIYLFVVCVRRIRASVYDQPRRDDQMCELKKIWSGCISCVTIVCITVHMNVLFKIRDQMVVNFFLLFFQVLVVWEKNFSSLCSPFYYLQWNEEVSFSVIFVRPHVCLRPILTH